MKPLSDKTAGFTDSVIRRMTRVSNQYGAVNLSQGFPDFDRRRKSQADCVKSHRTDRISMP